MSVGLLCSGFTFVVNENTTLREGWNGVQSGYIKSKVEPGASPAWGRQFFYYAGRGYTVLILRLIFFSWIFLCHKVWDFLNYLCKKLGFFGKN